MKPIIIAYHCCTTYNREWAFQLIRQQMQTLAGTGLAEAAETILIGLNGSQQDAEDLGTIVPKRASVLLNDKDLWPAGEVGTLRMLAEWIHGFGPSNVLYFHTKGLSFPPDHGNHGYMRDWRLRMEAVVLHRWRECVSHLESGAESVGQWWNVAFNGSYWAGNFFWATSDFLKTLPYLDIKDQNEGGRYEAEVWIGRGPRLPRIVSL